jgi:hypothetical protein
VREQNGPSPRVFTWDRSDRATADSGEPLPSSRIAPPRSSPSLSSTPSTAPLPPPCCLGGIPQYFRGTPAPQLSEASVQRVPLSHPPNHQSPLFLPVPVMSRTLPTSIPSTSPPSLPSILLPPWATLTPGRAPRMGLLHLRAQEGAHSPQELRRQLHSRGRSSPHLPHEVIVSARLTKC